MIVLYLLLFHNKNINYCPLSIIAFEELFSINYHFSSRSKGSYLGKLQPSTLLKPWHHDYTYNTLLSKTPLNSPHAHMVNI